MSYTHRSSLTFIVIIKRFKTNSSYFIFSVIECSSLSFFKRKKNNWHHKFVHLYVFSFCFCQKKLWTIVNFIHNNLYFPFFFVLTLFRIVLTFKLHPSLHLYTQKEHLFPPSPFFHPNTHTHKLHVTQLIICFHFPFAFPPSESKCIVFKFNLFLNW